MAAEIGCSRWVVTEAYGQLAAEGYLDGQTGSGTRVRMAGVPAAAAAPARAAAAEVAIDLAPGLPDLRAFPVTRWVAAVRAAAATMPVADLGYPDPAGHLPARFARCLARLPAGHVLLDGHVEVAAADRKSVV